MLVGLCGQWEWIYPGRCGLAELALVEFLDVLKVERGHLSRDSFFLLLFGIGIRTIAIACTKTPSVSSHCLSCGCIFLCVVIDGTLHHYNLFKLLCFKLYFL